MGARPAGKRSGRVGPRSGRGPRTAAKRVGRLLPASYAHGLGPAKDEEVVVMAGRGLRARIAGAPRGLRLGVVALAGLGLGAGIARGWRWLTGSGWDREDVAELYGEQT